MGGVAHLADVSMQTVLHVATGSDHVRPNTRTKVLRVVNRLGYSPNHAAQALRCGSFKIIGVLTRQIQRTGGALTIADVLEVTTAADYAVNLVQAERPVSGDLCQAVYRPSHQVTDGLVVVQVGRAGCEHLVLPPSIPVAVSDSTFVGCYPPASTDQVGGVRNVVRHLLGFGYRNIQHAYGPGDSQSSLIRRATRARCPREVGLSVPEPIPSGQGTTVGYATDRLLAADPEVTTVLCVNNKLALGLIRVMHRQDRWVLGDVSIVDFDGPGVDEYGFPPLIAVRRDFRRRGRKVMSLMLEQVTFGVRDDSRNIIISTESILRNSAASPPTIRETSTVRHHIPKLVESGHGGRVVRVRVTPSANWLSRAAMEEWSVLGPFLLQAG